jgi:adenosine deaminase
VVLHDHLDGGLRPQTVLDLADACGHLLPAVDVASLRSWFHQGRSGSLERYLEAFVHTVGVMQTADAVERVAYEAAVDLAADGVVYAEVRFDPGLCTAGGLHRFDVVEAALAGLSRARRDIDLAVYLVVSGLRHRADTMEAARAAVRFAGDGVVGFDLAGPEAGFPPDVHLPAIRAAADAGLGITLHAGEGAGPHSMWLARAQCGAQRLGHGVRIVDDTDFDGRAIDKMGRFATRVRDQRIPLEVAITSNIHTGTFASAEVHPFGALLSAGFNVSLNTDNRLMSDVTVSGEYELARQVFGIEEADLAGMTVRALEAGFGPWPERRRIIADVVSSVYAV